ncbi:MAG: hypothetical protein M1837_004117 [Sclerophora amabilis]|nr:MAG: hypothetical protein M1837_004117 [Sclerophora amabilis]
MRVAPYQDDAQRQPSSSRKDIVVDSLRRSLNVKPLARRAPREFFPAWKIKRRMLRFSSTKKGLETLSIQSWIPSLDALANLNAGRTETPFLKSYTASSGEQVNIAACPCTQISLAFTAHILTPTSVPPKTSIQSPAFAIETCTCVFAPLQRLSQEGFAKNTPSGIDVETLARYNGRNTVSGPDGSLIAKPDKDFEGFVFVKVRNGKSTPPPSPTFIPDQDLLEMPFFVRQIDVEEAHLPKSLADSGGHSLRPDLMLLLVDKTKRGS